MDNVTHAALGFGVYAIWLSADQNAPLSLQHAVLGVSLMASECPDVDVVTRLVSRTLFLRTHRTATHSMAGIALMAVFLTWVWRFADSGHDGLLFTIALVNAGVHVLTDVLTPYGTACLWPFVKRRFALDVLFVYDPIFLCSTALGLLLWMSGEPLKSDVHIATLCTLLWLAIRVANRWKVRHHFRRHARLGKHLLACPPALAPWRQPFVLLLENKDLQFGEVSWWSPPRVFATFRTQPQTDGMDILTRSDLGRSFLQLCRVPVAWSEPTRTGVRLCLADGVFRTGFKLPFYIWATVRTCEQEDEGNLQLVEDGLSYHAVSTPLHPGFSLEEIQKRLL
ncbi:MAG: metal-dependent hydrolase [Alicyclobacillaceae bacterium]|nr:metal-dependent hydrolase [Alicyclobacillaceae bacterium]